MTDQGASSTDQPHAGPGRDQSPAQSPVSTQTGSVEAPSDNVPNSGPPADPGARQETLLDRWLGMARDAQKKPDLGRALPSTMTRAPMGVDYRKPTDPSASNGDQTDAQTSTSRSGAHDTMGGRDDNDSHSSVRGAIQSSTPTGNTGQGRDSTAVQRSEQ